jgi:hypothetical protein
LKVDLGEEDWFAVAVVNALVEPGVPVERPEGVVAILDTETIIVEREGMVEQSVKLLWPQRYVVESKVLECLSLCHHPSAILHSANGETMKGRETDDLGPSQPRVSLNTVGIASRSHIKRKRKTVYA